MSTELPKLIRFLTEELKFRLRQQDVVAGFGYYLVDLSGWKLRLTDRTPFIRIESRHLEAMSSTELVAGIRTALRSRHLQRHVPILMIEGRSDELLEAVRDHLPYCAFMDEEEMFRITSGTVTDKRMLDLICAQLPLSTLAPYEISSPVIGSRFFGREYEIRTILNHPDTDYVVVGVRRIGKSSLLQELKRRMEQDLDDYDDDRSVFFFDCSDFHSTEDYIRAVTTEVDIRERERMTFSKFPNFLRYKSYRGKRPLTFLLDEIDHLIHFDRQQNWALLNVLRASSNKGFCRYILTGYREAIEESLNDRSPLFNFVTRLPLGNLSREETQRLVTVPMENLGVSFERRGELIGQIFQQTAGHPNFVQFYCYTLIQLMDRENRRWIAPNDLAAVHGDQEFERYVFRTFTANTTDLEKAVVYGIVQEHDDQFTLREVDVALKKRKVFVTAGELEEACDNLRTACVLDKQGQTYTFAIPILTRLLRDHYDVEHLFIKAKEDGKLGQ
jgi:hypothetical protein